MLGFASKAHIVAQGQLDDNEGRDTLSPTAGMRFLILLFNILALLGATFMQFALAEAILRDLRARRRRPSTAEPRSWKHRLCTSPACLSP